MVLSEVWPCGQTPLPVCCKSSEVRAKPACCGSPSRYRDCIIMWPGVGRHKTWATHPEHNRRIALPGIALPLGCRVSAAGSLGGACRRRALAGCARCQCCTRAARVICSGQALLRVRPWTSRGMPMVPSAVFCAKAGRPH